MNNRIEKHKQYLKSIAKMQPEYTRDNVWYQIIPLSEALRIINAMKIDFNNEIKK